MAVTRVGERPEYVRCDPCGQDHGPLYVCPNYSPERQAEIQRASDEHVRSLQDPAWVRAQLERGATMMELQIFGWFSGVEVQDPGRPS